MEISWGAVVAVAALVVVLAGGIAFLLWRTNARQRAERGADLARLEKDAAAALVRMDELIRLAEDEASFATAEFGPRAADRLLGAVRHARARLSQAFELRQLLADSIPDTDEQRVQWNRQIVQLCTSAEQEVRTETTSLAHRRSAVRQAPDAIGTVRTQVAEARALLAPARARLAHLAERFAPSALTAVATNADQAEQLLDFAERGLDIAADRLATRRAEDANKAIRAAGEALGRAQALLAAVDAFELDALDANAALAAVVADSNADIAQARQLPAGDAAEVADAVAGLERALEAVPRPGAPGDPFAALSTLTDANAALERAVRQIHGRAERAAHVQRQLAAAKDEAARQIGVTRQVFVRYGGLVGADARTALASAVRELDDADVEAEEDAALARARRSADLAVRAATMAHDDARARAHEDSQYADPRYGSSYGQHAPRIGGTFRGSDVVGGILGGIVLGEILDGFDGVEDFFD